MKYVLINITFAMLHTIYIQTVNLPRNGFLPEKGPQRVEHEPLKLLKPAMFHAMFQVAYTVPKYIVFWVTCRFEISRRKKGFPSTPKVDDRLVFRSHQKIITGGLWFYLENRTWSLSQNNKNPLKSPI